MSLLKIRDPDGTVRVITIMKGDKGDGVPNGGNAGQVIRKTEDGTEWHDLFATDPIILSNTADDKSVTSVNITKKGLYDIRARVYFPGTRTYSHFFRSVVSVADLNESFDQLISGSIDSDGKGTYYCIRFENGTISSLYHIKPDGQSHPCLYLTEVRLLIPYN